MAVEKLPRAFACCIAEIEAGNDIVEPFAVRVRAEKWPHRESGTDHELQLPDPEGIAAILDELVNSS